MSPSVKPIRERIERAVKAQLATIVESDVYWFTLTPDRIRRSLLDIDNVKYSRLLATGPIVSVTRASGALYNPDYTQTSDQHQHVFAVWGYVAGDMEDDDRLAGDLINRLWADHVTALLADRELGGLVQTLRPDGPMDTDDGTKEPNALFRQHWLALT